MRTAAALSLLLPLCAPAPAAAQQAQVWKEVEPHYEEFVALMPRPLFTLTRELPFDENLTLTPLIREATDDGVHFLVLSFRKSEPARGPDVLRTFDGFTGGFEHSVRRNRHTRDNSLERGDDVTLPEGKMRAYRIRMGGREGVARLYEAAKHFYAVVALGGDGGDGRVDRFLESFKLKPGESVPAGGGGGWGSGVAGGRGYTSGETPPMPPPGPWPLPSRAAPDAPVFVGVLNGKALKRPSAEYPDKAREALVTGRVVVRITFDETGRVIYATATSGHPLLQEAAVKASYKARFEPVKRNGATVKASGLLVYQFNIH